MRLLRTVAAISVGIGFMALTRTVAASLTFPGASLMVSALGAVMAGWLSARTAPFAPFGHAVALAVLAAALSVVTAASARSDSPLGYVTIITIVDLMGVLLGGKLRAAAQQAAP